MNYYTHSLTGFSDNDWFVMSNGNMIKTFLSQILDFQFYSCILYPHIPQSKMHDKIYTLGCAVLGHYLHGSSVYLPKVWQGICSKQLWAPIVFWLYFARKSIPIMFSNTKHSHQHPKPTTSKWSAAQFPTLLDYWLSLNNIVTNLILMNI